MVVLIFVSYRSILKTGIYDIYLVKSEEHFFEKSQRAMVIYHLPFMWANPQCLWADTVSSQLNRHNMFLRRHL